jgi:hypothetical protein
MKPAQRFNLTLQQHRQAQEREQQRERDQVVAEFAGDPQRLADEILRLRRGIYQVGEAIEWLKTGRPFAMIPPGPESSEGSK